jgi:hypothetical protein
MLFPPVTERLSNRSLRGLQQDLRQPEHEVAALWLLSCQSCEGGDDGKDAAVVVGGVGDVELLWKMCLTCPSTVLGLR